MLHGHIKCNIPSFVKNKIRNLCPDIGHHSDLFEMKTIIPTPEGFTGDGNWKVKEFVRTGEKCFDSAIANPRFFETILPAE